MWAVVDGAGLQCGGSLMQRAERLFLTKTKALSELPPSVFAGAKGKRKRSAAAAPAAVAESEVLGQSNKESAMQEAQIAQLCELLHSVVEQTKIQIEKKQTRTMEELEAELEEDAPHDGHSDSDDEEKAIYNPKNLPLGWDGKPIPYWLYKLHGATPPPFREWACRACSCHRTAVG